MSELKCRILSVKIYKSVWKLKRRDNTCILQNQLDKFSHRISSYKMSRNVKEWGAFPYVPLILYKGIRCENLYSWFCRIHVVFSSHRRRSLILADWTLFSRRPMLDVHTKCIPPSLCLRGWVLGWFHQVDPWDLLTYH